MYLTDNIIKLSNKIGQRVYTVVSEMSIEAWITKKKTQVVSKMDKKYDTHIAQGGTNVSGGQKQRLAIARAIAMKPSIIICDEPVSALDVSIQAQVINLLMDLQKMRNITYIFITHDISLVKRIADKVAVMQNGQIVEQGTTESIFAHPQHKFTKKLLNC